MPAVGRLWPSDGDDDAGDYYGDDDSTIIVIQVRERYPGSKCDLQTDRLYVDGRMFVWNKRAEKVFVEQLIIISKL